MSTSLFPLKISQKLNLKVDKQHERVLEIISHQVNVNQNHNEILLHTH